MRKANIAQGKAEGRESKGTIYISYVGEGPVYEEVCTCTIITTEANDLLTPLHDRMPVIIP